MNRIFEPFYTKKVMNRRNSGLGLSVVWGTVKDLEGSIDIISSENAGTVFDLYFPAVEQKADAHPALVDVSAYRGRGERILVVDDEEGQREITSAILSRLGYAPVTAPGGEEAIRLLRKETVDLVVLDMIMDNGPDGLQTYREILKIRPGQKAIISSGFAEEERAEKAMTLGAGAFVRKPHTAESLGTAVRKELDRPALRDNFRHFKS